MKNEEPELIAFVDDRFSEVKTLFRAAKINFPDHEVICFQYPEQLLKHLEVVQQKVALVVSGMWFQGDGEYPTKKYGGQHLFERKLKQTKTPTIIFTHSDADSVLQLQSFRQRHSQDPNFDFFQKWEWEVISKVIAKMKELIERSTPPDIKT
ncbi:hypothetical protein HN954_04620 [bacterium]|jgi:hypothetical protein|nr:hypothetical protein [bacterium]MBT6831703.1 hypothetical protein [bacterium]MBT6996683.1 hypothetical protein [bacterium]MBT7772852.1 hypothetical protein [bacterium]